MITAVVYLRCSDADQDRSVADQRTAIEAQAARDGVRITPGGWFVDDGISGLTVSDRPGLLSLRKWVQEWGEGRHAPGERLVLYAWAQSRLGRQPSDTIATLAILDVAGVETRFLTDPEPADVEMREMLRFQRAITDGQHSRRLSKDVPRGMQSRAREGRWTCGRAPFGYRIHHDVHDRSGRLVVEPVEAAVVQLVVELYERGEGFKNAAKLLTERGVTPPGCATVWVSKAVADIVTNPVYAGRIVMKGETRHAAAHAAIIEPERWDRLQAMRRSKFRERVRENPVVAGDHGIFKPWLRCSVCGGGMGVQHGIPGRFHYACRARTRRKASCTGINAPIDLLDPLLLTRIENDVLSDATLRAAADRWRASMEGDGRVALQADRERIEARITDAEAAIKRAVAMVVRRIVEEGDMDDEIKLHRAARDAARDELALLPVPLPLPTVTVMDIAAFRSRIVTALKAKPIQEQRSALATLISSITLAPNTVTVQYRPRMGTVGQPEVASSGGPEGSW